MISRAKKSNISWNCLKSKILAIKKAKKYFEIRKKKKKSY